MIESGFITSVEQSISSTGSTVVALLNFLTEDVFDEDEVEELLRDAAELLSPFGTVLDMRCQPPAAALAEKDNGQEPSPQDIEHTLQGSSELHVTFASPAEAYAAACALDGLVIGGEAIRTRLVGDAGSVHRPVGSLAFAGPGKGEARVIYGIEGVEGMVGMHAVELWNVVRAEDVLDPEEAEEVLADICFLCEAYGTPVTSTIRDAVSFVSGGVNRYVPSGYSYVRASAGMDLSRGAPETAPQPLDLPVAFIRCSDVRGAIRAAEKIQGVVLGGQEISVAMYDIWALEQARYRQAHLIQVPSVDVSASESRYGLRVWMSTRDSNSCINRDSIEAVVRLFVQERLAAIGGASPSNNPIASLLELLATCEILVPDEGIPGIEGDSCDALIGPLSFESCLGLQEALGSPSDNTANTPDTPFSAVRFDVCAMMRIQHTSVWQRDVGRNDVQTIVRGTCCGDCGDVDKVLPSECVLAVSGFISEDDVLDAIAFPEEIAALKSELMQLLGLPHVEGSVEGWSYCKGCSLVTEERVRVSEERLAALEWMSTPYVRLEFLSPEEARSVMFAFDGSVMGGEVVMAKLTENQADSRRRGMLKNATLMPTGAPQSAEAAAPPKLPRHAAPLDSTIPVRSACLRL
jgi:hypothetical protein